MTVIGIDACRGGWIGIALEPDGMARAVWGASLNGLTEQVGPLQVIAIDIPIGLSAQKHREADLAAREILGPRRSSVFLTPARAALLAPTHAEATAISSRLTGKGVSRQGYALRHRILEAERFARRAAAPVREVHPEVSFALMLGHPARASKKTWAGFTERLGAIGAAGLHLGELGDAGARAAADDVLDAAAAAWTAARLARGEAVSFPDPPGINAESGQPMAIWA